MRLLVTGNRGYIGTVMAPFLEAAGHEVVGLDSDFYEACTFGGALPSFPELRKDIRDVEKRDLEGFDAVVHLAALSNDPLGDLNPDSPTTSTTAARCTWPPGQGGGRPAVRLLLLLQQLRRGGRRDGHGGIAAASRDAVRRLQGPGGTRRREARGRPVQPRLSCARRRPTAFRRGFASTSS